MISNISFMQGVQNISPNQVSEYKEIAESTPISVPDNEVNFKGAEALGNYNRANILTFDRSILNVEPVLPTIIQPDAIGVIEGEKIYSSNGKLNSIINRVGDKVVVYTISPDNDNFIESIVTTDKKTGNVIKKQTNDIENGKYKEMDVREFDPQSGKEIKNTLYSDGKPVIASKIIQQQNGLIQYINYDYENKHYNIDEMFADGRKYNKCYTFNKNKDLISIYEHKGNQHSNVEFYKGAIISVNQNKTKVLPNNMGREVLNDPDIIPSSLSSYPESIEGEKTFYSNGSLESVKAGNLVYNYSPEGNVTSIKDGNKTISTNENSTKIVEVLDDGAVKTTILDNNGIISVDYIKGEYTKQLYLQNGVPMDYSEKCGEKTIKSLSFDDKGMLESAWGDEV